MTQSIVIRNVGPTTAISVTATSSAAVTVAGSSNDQVAFASFLNTGATVVALTIAPSAITAPASVLPVGGTPQTVIMLPASMVMPAVYSVPSSFSVTAIGSAAGPSLVYITPVAGQS